MKKRILKLTYDKIKFGEHDIRLLSSQEIYEKVSKDDFYSAYPTEVFDQILAYVRKTPHIKYELIEQDIVEVNQHNNSSRKKIFIEEL